MYALLFLVGFFGFLGMAGMSFLHSGHDGHTGNHGSMGEAVGSLKALQHSHARPHNAGGPRIAHAKGAKIAKGYKPWWAFSPFDLMAYCTGAGAVGEILRQQGLAPNVVLGAALVGALLFNFGLAKPVLNGLLRFESRQSEGLEGQVAQHGEAVSRFDAQGRGLVRLSLDGEIVQVLGLLDPEERDRGVKVLKGDPLVVVDIDAAKNTCRVTRELAS